MAKPIRAIALEGELVDRTDENEVEKAKVPKVGYLATLPQIRREMSIVYRAARKQQVPLEDGTKLMYMLKGLLDAESTRMKMTELERQRAELGMPVFTGFDVKLLANDSDKDA